MVTWVSGPSVSLQEVWSGEEWKRAMFSSRTITLWKLWHWFANISFSYYLRLSLTSDTMVFRFRVDEIKLHSTKCMQVNLRIILPNENKRHGRIQTVWVPRLYVPACQRYQHWLYRATGQWQAAEAGVQQWGGRDMGSMLTPATSSGTSLKRAKTWDLVWGWVKPESDSLLSAGICWFMWSSISS